MIMYNDFKRQIFKIIIQTIIISGLAVLIIVFAAQKISKESKALTAKRSNFVIWENRGERLVILQKDYKKIEKAVPYLSALLPTEDQLINFISTIESTAKETNNQQSFNFAGGINEARGDEPKNINFTINLQGNINSFIAYLKKIQTIPFYIKIINFNVIGGQGLNNQSQMNLLGRVYLR